MSQSANTKIIRGAIALFLIAVAFVMGTFAGDWDFYTESVFTFLWTAVLGFLIGGAIFCSLPALVLANVSSRLLFTLGVIACACLTASFTYLARVSTDDQAGVQLMGIPVYGSLVAGAVWLLDNFRERRRATPR